MIKILLIALIVMGGFTLMSHYCPQLIGAVLLNVAGFSITGGVVAIILLITLGVKFVSGKH